jgi:hypothetical protein
MTRKGFFGSLVAAGAGAVGMYAKAVSSAGWTTTSIQIRKPKFQRDQERYERDERNFIDAMEFETRLIGAGISLETARSMSAIKRSQLVL